MLETILQLFFLVFFLFFFVFFVIQFYNIVFRGYAPFISTGKKVIAKIFQELDLDKNFSGTVYELGCGKAGFLNIFHKHYPKANLIGIEYEYLLFIISKVQQALKRNKIKIIRKNIFQADLSKADLIYCYLNVKMMKELEKKFKKECQPGTRIISYAFSLPEMKAIKELKMDNKIKIYFYKL
ncbi:MAG: class I SAM-dependent methyltransferase [Patescibacteria group bacterium]